MNDQRLQLALEVMEKLNAAKRTDAPPDDEKDAWVEIIDMDTNKPFWVPKDLSDEYQRLRFTRFGKP